MIMKMLSSELFKEIYGNTHPPEGYCQEFHITHSSNSQFKTKLYSISRNSRPVENIFISKFQVWEYEKRDLYSSNDPTL